jgi:multiple sugar transport system substrate-binding protein
MTKSRGTLVVNGIVSTVALMAMAAGVPALAQDKPDVIRIFSHPVHERVSTGNQGGDITTKWQSETGISVEWNTLDVAPLQDRLFREMTLPATSIDIGFLLDRRALPRIADLLEPLNDLQASDPIEDLDDIAPGMRAALTFDGKLYGIPFRHATSGLHWNQELFAERGIDGPPKTMEDLIAAAKALSFTRADGTKVTGLAILSDPPDNIIDFARAWDADFVTPDLKVVANSEGMIKAVAGLRELFEAGALDQSVFFTNDRGGLLSGMQQGRYAMSFSSTGRNRLYNDPEKAASPGAIQTTTIPPSASMADTIPVAPAKTAFWAMVIPKNSANKAFAWSLVKAMSSKESTLMAALNGNGPVRGSTYAEATFKEKIPFAEAEMSVLAVARLAIPAFDDAARASDIMVELVQAAVLGQMSPEDAMNTLQRRVEPLLNK